jgi:ribosomal protein S17
LESYKKAKKLKKFLNTPKMKKLHKEAMKFQGGDKVTKMVKDQAES